MGPVLHAGDPTQPTRPVVGGMTYRIDVPMVVGYPGRPLSLNDRFHWRVKAQHVATIREAVAWTARSLRIGQLSNATIQLHYAPGRGGKHDADNLVATSKPAVDGLRDAGVIVDDSTEHITQLMPTIHPGKGHRALWLEIEVTP
jgi:crossover junction endodeoxyribonuclease RusA